MVTRWTERLLSPYKHVSARSISIIVLVNYVTFDLYAVSFSLWEKSRKQNQIVRNYIVFGNDCFRLNHHIRTCYVLQYYVHVYLLSENSITIIFFCLQSIFLELIFS